MAKLRIDLELVEREPKRTVRVVLRNVWDEALALRAFCAESDLHIKPERPDDPLLDHSLLPMTLSSAPPYALRPDLEIEPGGVWSTEVPLIDQFRFIPGTWEYSVQVQYESPCFGREGAPLLYAESPLIHFELTLREHEAACDAHAEYWRQFLRRGTVLGWVGWLARRVRHLFLRKKVWYVDQEAQAKLALKMIEADRLRGRAERRGRSDGDSERVIDAEEPSEGTARG